MQGQDDISPICAHPACGSACCQGHHRCPRSRCCHTHPACAAHRHILLVGFMGAGKSTTARKLARLCGMMSLDTDIFIARETGISTQDLFCLEGEAAFRDRECQTLRKLESFDPCIISCGGGIVMNPESRAVLKRMGTVVYFKVDPNEAVARISRPETRPLLGKGKTPEELLAERQAFYEEVADITLDISGMTSSRVAYTLIDVLRAEGVL